MSRYPALRRFTAAAAIVCALALGACGSEDSDTTASDDMNGATGTASGGADGGKGDDKTADKAGPAAAEGNAVLIQDFVYVPDDLKVKPGTTVTFTNKDDAAHTVTATDKSFDSKNMEKDATFEHTFDEAGTFKYICDIHNYMTGQVTVA